jgi:WD40 repeat protein
MESPLVLEKSSELSLGGISLGSLVYLSNDGLLVGSESSGRVHCYDIVSKRKLSSFDPSTGLPSLFAVAGHSDKLVVCNGSSLGSRKSLDGRLLLDTILQPPLNDHEALVRIEILHEEVILLLNEMKSLRHISTDMTSLVARLIKVFDEYIERENKLNHLDTEESHDQIRNWSYCIIEEPLKGLYELFNKMFLQYQPAKANSGGARPSSSTDPLPPVAEIISAIRFRLHLLHPVHYPHVHNLETGLENLSNNADTALMLSEGMRRISFNNWIHKDYLWAEQNKMSEAGLYLFVNTPVNHLVSTAKGDRTTCFTCGIYIHRWLPSDEPWSEHTRHSKCPFMRGEFTLNVPAKFTEGTHSSVHCISPVTVMSNVSDSNMVAVATVDNKIQLWDIGHSLFIHV